MDFYFFAQLLNALKKSEYSLTTVFFFLFLLQPVIAQEPQDDFDFENRVIDSLGIGLTNSTVTGNLGFYNLAFQVTDLAVDNEGNRILVGQVNNSRSHDFDPSESLLEFPNSQGSGEIAGFVVSFDRSGNLNYGFQITDIDISPDVKIFYVDADSNGNIYLLGTYRGKADLDPGDDIFELSSGDANLPGYFVASYDSNGNFRWANPIPESTLHEPGGSLGNIFAVDDGGNIVFLVDPKVEFDVDPGEGEFVLEAFVKNYVVSYDSSGNFRLAYEVYPSTFTVGCSPQGTIYIAGWLSESGNAFDFDPGTPSVNIPGNSNSSFFLASYSEDAELNFANGMEGVLATPVKIVGDIDENIYLAGKMLNGTIDFDADPSGQLEVSISTFESDGGDIFMASYDAEGRVLMAEAIEDKVGEASSETVEDLEVDQFGNVTISGLFRGGTIDFDLSEDSDFNLSAPRISGFDTYVGSWTKDAEFRFAFAIRSNSGTNTNALGLDSTCPVFYLTYNDYDVTATGVLLGISNGDESSNPECSNIEDDSDSDSDGIVDSEDICPDTAMGAVVNFDGCEIFSLPASNFTILTKAETCIANNDGQLEINAEESLPYEATLSQGDIEQIQQFTQSISFNELFAGDYELCITVEGQEEFSQCFQVAITEPEPLTASSKVNLTNKSVTLDLNGSNSYTININEKTYRTTEHQVTLPLDKIENTITVFGEKDCQGIHREVVVLTNGMFAYPNPIAKDYLNVYLGSPAEFTSVRASVFDLSGAKVLEKTIQPQNGYIELDLDNLSQGTYILSINNSTELLNHKILKR